MFSSQAFPLGTSFSGRAIRAPFRNFKSDSSFELNRTREGGALDEQVVVRDKVGNVLKLKLRLYLIELL